MSDQRFESHLLSVSSMPFIFHNNVKAQPGVMGHNWHPNIELLYFTEGSGIVYIGETAVQVCHGDIVIVNSDLLHSFDTVGGMRYYCLIPDRDFCTFNGIDTDNIRFAEKITDEYAARLYEAVAEAFDDGSSYRDACVKSAVMNLLVYLAKNHTEHNSAHSAIKSAKGDEGIKLALGYIRSHISERLTIDELCDQAGLSKYYFVREFKKIIGDTPIVYINKLRCENAKKMLAKGELSIGEIAEKCGFDSMSYFGKVFKKYTGVTPGGYIMLFCT